MKNAIIIMAKVPRAGNVKTRLHSVLAPEKCAELATVFLEDTVNKAKKVCANTIIAFFPTAEKDKLTEILPDEKNLIAQTGKNLGARMFSAFEFAFTNGSDAVVMIGTDSPTFPLDFINQAFEFLEKNADTVLGKTEDGGFYLIGLRMLPKEIFANVAWSSSETFDRVYQNIMSLNLNLSEVPVWYDVDEPIDLERLKKELLQNSNARRRAPQTFEWIEKNAFEFPL